MNKTVTPLWKDIYKSSLSLFFYIKKNISLRQFFCLEKITINLSLTFFIVLIFLIKSNLSKIYVATLNVITYIYIINNTKYLK